MASPPSFHTVYFFLAAILLIALIQLVGKVFSDPYHFHLAILAGFTVGVTWLGFKAGLNKWMVGAFGLLSLTLIGVAWFIIWN